MSALYMPTGQHDTSDHIRKETSTLKKPSVQPMFDSRAA